MNSVKLHFDCLLIVLFTIVCHSPSIMVKHIFL